MRKDAKDFLVRLLDEPAPSNFETPAQAIWREWLDPHVDRVETDVYGNHTAILEGSDAFSLMVVGHADEVGLIVRRIDDEGMLWFGTIGGLDAAVLPGTRVRILARGGEVAGVVGRPAIHLQPRGEPPPKRPKITDLYIDIGAKDRKDAEKRVSVGDPAVFGEDFRELGPGFASHRCFDNRVGGWIVAEMMRQLSRKKNRRATVYGVSSVQEECGVFGAGLVADRYLPTAAIAVDVTHDTSTPGISRTAQADVRCGRGPVLVRGVRGNRALGDLLERAAKAAKIPYQIEIDEGATGTDADPVSARRTGIPTANVSIACRYMHTPCEVVHLDDLVKAAALLARFAERLSDRTVLAPR